MTAARRCLESVFMPCSMLERYGIVKKKKARVGPWKSSTRCLTLGLAVGVKSKPPENLRLWLGSGPEIHRR